MFAELVVTIRGGLLAYAAHDKLQAIKKPACLGLAKFAWFLTSLFFQISIRLAWQRLPDLGGGVFPRCLQSVRKQARSRQRRQAGVR